MPTITHDEYRRERYTGLRINKSTFLELAQEQVRLMKTEGVRPSMVSLVDRMWAAYKREQKKVAACGS